MNPPNAPPPQTPIYKPSSGLSVAAFVISIVGLIGGLVPFVGFIGTIGLLMGIYDWRSKKTTRVHGLSISAMIIGGMATIGAITWVIAVAGLSVVAKRGSCPHLYAFDGTAYQLDADLASGALYKGAERDDTDRLESLRAIDGTYRVRLQNDLQEVDNIDSLALLVVDAPPGVDVLPTQSGVLLPVRNPSVPLERTVQLSDGRESTTFEFARPTAAAAAAAASRSGKRAMLILRARNTQFAEEAFIAYMAKMGQGVRPLLEAASSSKEGCACYHKYLDEEIARLGLPLTVTVSSTSPSNHKNVADRSLTTTRSSIAVGASPPSSSSVVIVQPIGPATLRSQAVPIDMPEGDGRIVVRLDATARFWEIAQVELAPYSDGDEDALDVQVRKPRSASTETSLDLVAETDERRLVIGPGEHVDVEFDAPPPPAPGKTRTIVARLRGYYDLDIGGQRGVNVLQIARHRLGLVSLPSFAQSL